MFPKQFSKHSPSITPLVEGTQPPVMPTCNSGHWQVVRHDQLQERSILCDEALVIEDWLFPFRQRVSRRSRPMGTTLGPVRGEEHHKYCRCFQGERTYTHTRACAHTLILSCTHTDVCTPTCAHTHAHMHAHMHIYEASQHQRCALHCMAWQVWRIIDLRAWAETVYVQGMRRKSDLRE